jgi:hypothetical protein
MFIFDDLYSAPGTDVTILGFGCLYLALRPTSFMPRTTRQPALRLLPPITP